MAPQRHDLFPPLEPIASDRLAVGNGHSLYWEECGNPAGAPAVFLHGGPGSGSSPTHRRFFDPEFYRVVLFDQRGAGRSTPFASIEANTTQHLVADLETLRRMLGIDRWLVFGGSWGSTLALTYAQRYPERVAGLVLRGVFLGRRSEIDWFLHGMGTIFPEAHRTFLEFLPAEERGDALASYLRRLNDADHAVCLPAARAWGRYEGSCSTLLPSAETIASFAEERLALGLARIEAHYMANAMFLAPDELLEGVSAIRSIPGAIIQGRYDIVCPPTTADALARAWPEASYAIIPDAGHSAMEPGIRTRLVAATEQMKSLGRW